MSLQLLDDDSNAFWTADLVEDGNEGDKEAATYRDAIAPFHGLSASGEAVGQIVYANYGTKDDYDKLVASGVDLLSYCFSTGSMSIIVGASITITKRYRPQLWLAWCLVLAGADVAAAP